MARIYLDHHSTTPCDPRVVEAMLPFFTQKFGNAASRTHAFGKEADRACDAAREQVAALIHADPSEIVYTSGGTESDNFAIRGAADALEPAGRRHLIASAIEHEAVLNTLKALARRGWRTTLIPRTCASATRFSRARLGGSKPIHQVSKPNAGIPPRRPIILGRIWPPATIVTAMSTCAVVMSPSNRSRPNQRRHSW